MRNKHKKATCITLNFLSSIWASSTSVSLSTPHPSVFPNPPPSHHLALLSPSPSPSLHQSLWALVVHYLERRLCWTWEQRTHPSSCRLLLIFLHNSFWNVIKDNTRTHWSCSASRDQLTHLYTQTLRNRVCETERTQKWQQIAIDETDVLTMTERHFPNTKLWERQR